MGQAGLDNTLSGVILLTQVVPNSVRKTVPFSKRITSSTGVPLTPGVPLDLDNIEPVPCSRFPSAFSVRVLSAILVSFV